MIMNQELTDLDFTDVEIIFFDFDGVFTDNKVYISENGLESVECSRSDGLGLSRIKSLGVKVFIVSTEKNQVVTQRASKLNVDCIQSVEDKSEVLKSICQNLNIRLDKAVFLGNDINDIPAYQIVGYPIGVNDSFNETLKYVRALTKKNGGQGAVRELCDLIYNQKNN